MMTMEDDTEFLGSSQDSLCYKEDATIYSLRCRETKKGPVLGHHRRKTNARLRFCDILLV